MIRHGKLSLTILCAALACTVSGAWAQQPKAEKGRPARYDLPPRKVIIGTTMTPWYGNYPGLESRLEEMCEMVDTMAADAKAAYGRSLDVAVFSEYAVTAGKQGPAAKVAVPMDDTILKALGAKAREHNCHIVFGGVFLDDPAKAACSNAAAVIDRKGRPVGRYVKVHPVLDRDATVEKPVFEGGVSPGTEFNVFDLDFGRIGLQICYDVEFPEGWKSMADQGADLVLFLTQSPQLTRPAMYAAIQDYWVVSSTFRNNASIFEPGTGLVAAQIREPKRTLVHEIDLSYVQLPWSPQMRNGAAFREKFGDRVGFSYSESEDRGVFWSNDPKMTIGEMARSVGLLEQPIEQHQRARKEADRLRGGPAR